MAPSSVGFGAVFFVPNSRFIIDSVTMCLLIVESVPPGDQYWAAIYEGNVSVRFGT